jgi:hypothetical protein
VKTLPLAALLTLTACGYQPPPRVDTASPVYVADRDTCEDNSATAVNRQNAKTGLAWFSSPFRRWGQISDATQSCMAGHGYGRLRWCTADELRSGDRQGNIIVTSSGVQCSDPPSARPADTSPPAPASSAKAAKRTPQ